MSLLIHLRNSRGQGCRLNAQSAIIHLGSGTAQLTDCTYLSFREGLLELDIDQRIQKIGLGEGFASMEGAEVTLVTNYYYETGDESGSASREPPDSNEKRYCIICDTPLNDELHCQVIENRRINLCCPHCVETFQRADQIIRNLGTKIKTLPRT